ncbi:MAG: glycosyltransferase family 2 protein [Ignavibacteria bacterium]|jgi:glycosyltransferase involved in cell wall biosynthesis|nr:glycosyltransferase family 2 protein [Ignavibacteria bacterium]
MKLLSVAIITLNEEKNLDRTLASIHSLADEIIIVDSGSTDKTQEVAEKYGATFIKQEWLGYGKQRNLAFSHCTGKWILCIDADEVVSETLYNNINQIINSDLEEKIFEINRKAFCFNKLIKYGDWANSYAIRLFQRGCGLFDEKEVHESFITDCNIRKLDKNSYLLHYSYNSVFDYLERFNKYTTLSANELAKSGKNAKNSKMVFSPIFSFLKSYIFKLGFLDGVVGFVISVLSAIYPLVKYFKLREIRQQN